MTYKLNKTSRIERSTEVSEEERNVAYTAISTLEKAHHIISDFDKGLNKVSTQLVERGADLTSQLEGPDGPEKTEVKKIFSDYYLHVMGKMTAFKGAIRGAFSLLERLQDPEIQQMQSTLSNETNDLVFSIEDNVGIFKDVSKNPNFLDTLPQDVEAISGKIKAIKLILKEHLITRLDKDVLGNIIVNTASIYNDLVKMADELDKEERHDIAGMIDDIIGGVKWRL